MGDGVAGETRERRNPVGNVGPPDRAQRQQVVQSQTGVGNGHQHQGHDNDAGTGTSHDREHLVVVDVLERMRQREDGCRRDGEADDHTQPLQSGVAAGCLLQHNGLQGVHPSGRR